MDCSKLFLPCFSQSHWLPHQLISQWRLALAGSTEVFTAISFGEIDYVSMKQHKYYTLYIIYGNSLCFILVK